MLPHGDEIEQRLCERDLNVLCKELPPTVGQGSAPAIIAPPENE